jgi:hypothetical protein
MLWMRFASLPVARGQLRDGLCRLSGCARSGRALRCEVGQGGLCRGSPKRALNVTPDVILKQLTIIGSHTFSSIGQANCAKFVADDGVDLDRHYAHRWTLNQAEQAYSQLDTQSGGERDRVMTEQPGVFELRAASSTERAVNDCPGHISRCGPRTCRRHGQV